MSSEGSCSVQSSESRIRQFGLYRTIDARTEEFLRLSRKRQIRQGCACAAASTAITVTVVVVMFFVYEFSLNSETNLESTLKSNWLTLMNDTSDIASFDYKLSKANIDRTTLKLLPLLIKAINKNAFLEKLLEDNQNASNSNEKRETTDRNTVDKNTFIQNWFKFPTTKLYAIEYKSSPVVYYKTPTQNIEYYAKTRKIRDHQRIFNYVDKMINEKVYIGATRPILREYQYTEDPVVPTRQKVKSREIEVKQTVLKPPSKPHNSVSQVRKKNDESMKYCKCPHLGTILSNILLRMQKLLPEINPKILWKDTKKIVKNTLVDVTKIPQKITSPIVKTNKFPKVTGWYDSKYEHIPNFIYHQENPSLEITTELNNYYEEDNFPVFSGTTDSIFLRSTIDDSIQNKNHFNIFGPARDTASVRPNYLIKTMGSEIDNMNFFKRGKKINKCNLKNTEDLVIKKFFKSALNSNFHNIIRPKKLKQISDITTKQPKTTVFIDDKLLLDFLKEKIDFSFADLEDNMKDVNNTKIMEPDSRKFSANEKTDLKVTLHKNSSNTTSKVQKSNNTSHIHKSKENDTEHAMNSTSFYKLNENEFENNIKPKIRYPKDIKVIPKKTTKTLEGTDHVSNKLTEKDLELLTANLKGHTKTPETIIDKAVQKLLKKKYEFDVEWEDVDMDIEPNLITANPNKQRSSYLQIGRTEGKKYVLREDEFSDHIYYENLNNNIM